MFTMHLDGNTRLTVAYPEPFVLRGCSEFDF